MKIIESELRYTLVKYKASINDAYSKNNFLLTALEFIGVFTLAVFAANFTGHNRDLECNVLLNIWYTLLSTVYFFVIFNEYKRVKRVVEYFQDYSILLHHIQDFDYTDASVEYFNEIVTGAKDLLHSGCT
jgi:hypothetical protein